MTCPQSIRPPPRGRRTPDARGDLLGAGSGARPALARALPRRPRPRPARGRLPRGLPGGLRRPPAPLPGLWRPFRARSCHPRQPSHAHRGPAPGLRPPRPPRGQAVTELRAASCSSHPTTQRRVLRRIGQRFRNAHLRADWRAQHLKDTLSLPPRPTFHRAECRWQRKRCQQALGTRDPAQRPARLPAVPAAEQPASEVLWLQLTLAGIASGSIAALSRARARVLTYRATGVFNFAHGAVAMFVAYLLWQLNIGWGWPLVVAAPLATPHRRSGHRAGPRTAVFRPLETKGASTVREARRHPRRLRGPGRAGPHDLGPGAQDRRAQRCSRRPRSQLPGDLESARTSWPSWSSCCCRRRALRSSSAPPTSAPGSARSSTSAASPTCPASTPTASPSLPGRWAAASPDSPGRC